MTSKPQVSEEEVAAIAKLARLGLTPEESKAATADLRNILSNFSRLQEIDTAAVPTSDDVTGLNNVTRPDQSLPDDLCQSATLLANAPAVHQNQLKVKAVFDDAA